MSQDDPYDLAAPRTRRHHERQERRRRTPPTFPRSSAEEDINYYERAIETAKKDLFLTIPRRERRHEPKVAALNIATAQRLVLAHMQHGIASGVEAVFKESHEPHFSLNMLTHQIKEYCDALRDLEYMEEYAARFSDDDEQDPFYLKSSKTLERQAMKDAGLIPNFMNPKGDLPRTRDNPRNPILPGRARSVANEAAKAERLVVRFLMATVGGLALIVPVLVMSFFPGRNVSLVTTSVAMLLFAAGITLMTKLTPDQVLGATAAYAAVLVVFVGTSLTTPA